MKILLILCILLFLVSLLWILSASQFSQTDGVTLNQELLTLSEKLLYKVKTDESVDTIQTALANYSVEDLRMGLINDDARKVFWINVYNANYQVLAIGEERAKNRIFTVKAIRFSDVSLSLDDIEHGILRKYRWKYGLGYLPQFLPSRTVKKLAVNKLDFRIHFALNCGSRSCPPIVFYQYEKLNDQLNIAVRSFLEGETIVDEASHKIYVTKIMQWFKGDFGGEAGIKRVLMRYLKKDFTNYAVQFKEYDWSEDLKNFSNPE